MVFALSGSLALLADLIHNRMTVVILRITRESWLTVRGHPHP
jgi:putative SOS response-associated peptidase YedK